jgi:hypothetical protein
MDFIAADIVSAPSRFSADESPRPARTARPSNSSGIRKDFSNVLQRARGEEGRADSRETDDIRSLNKSQNKPQVNEARGRDGSSVRTDRADASSSKTSERGRSDEDMNRSVEGSREDAEFSTVEDDAPSNTQRSESQSVSAPTSTPITTDTIDQEPVRTEDDSRSSGDEHQATTAPFLSTLMPPEASMPSMTALETHEGASPSDGAVAQLKDQPGKASVMSAHPTEGDAPAGLMVKDGQQAVVGGTDTKTIVADADVHAASSGEETGRPRPQPDALSRRESNLNSAPAPNDVGINRPMNDPARIAEGVMIARPASLHSEGHAQSHDGKKDSESKTEVVLPVDDSAQSVSDDGTGESKVSAVLPRGHHSNFDVTKHFSELRAGQNGFQHDQAGAELPQAAVVEQQVSNGQSTESIMAGAHGRVASSPPSPPSTAPIVSQPQPSVPSHDTAEKSVHVMGRSVVFDVAQPDLGHVNIRVAITNDVVHTHLSADRPEVGQFLINGQDRLQTAFQANGLDMGQFRVDIDRQGAGRSFQQGQFQEQGQAWNQGSHGMEHEHGHRDRQDEPRRSLHGLLNLVA